MTSGLRRPAEYARRENFTPGKTSSVTPPLAGPPGLPRPRRLLVVVVVLVGGHRLPVVDPPRPILRGSLAEGARHLAHVDRDRATTGADEIDAHRGRLPGVLGHVPARQGEGFELERELREAREGRVVVRGANGRAAVRNP